MFSRVIVVAVALVCSACGSGDPRISETSIALHAPALPECFVENPRRLGLVTGGATPEGTTANGALTIPQPALTLDATSSMRQFELSMLLAAAHAVTEPILDEPNALDWQWVGGNDGFEVHVEGESIARTEDSGSLSLRVWVEGERLERSWSVDVSYTPIATVYDFGDTRVRASDRYLSVGEWERGCAPERMSFERGVGAIFAECWHNTGRPIQSLFCEQLVVSARP